MKLGLNWGLWIGLILFFYFLEFPIDPQLNPEAQHLFAVAVLMAVWWMTEALPLAVTSLLPLILYPILGIMKTSDISPNYMNHLIFLFMGGFLIAEAIQKWGLHKRFALITIYWMGRNTDRLILGFMLVAAFMSMWISNTATAIMLMPIGVAVIRQLRPNDEVMQPKTRSFETVLMLAIAYGCSMGGTATLIGTPPNLVFAGIYRKFFESQPEVYFSKWMMLMLPLSLLLITFVYLYLVKVILKKKDSPQIQNRDFLKTEIQSLGKLSDPQKKVLIVFVVTALLWIFRGNIDFGGFSIPGWSHLIGLGDMIQDSTIAVAMAILLFIIPGERDAGKERKSILVLGDFTRIPWDILLLFGGGFALAEGIQKTGLAEYIAKNLMILGSIPLPFLILIICLSITLLTELTSNTAVAATFLPVLATFASHTDISPLLLMLPATIAASCAFMLPVSTPPNAIVFSTRYVSIRNMVSIGFVLILICSMTISLYFLFLNWLFPF
jgi:sodium-dependent dicarboxylate transporter 2/3/5